ncbi:type IV pilus assembly protein PilF [Nitrosomonas eutropha]|uniref:Type IV pilus assembly protein PilF n=1 Tax=Nitrosomonas eutropha TaxID=916 RepID=A0A1I7H8L4_9PROT|nr:type IV pilus biogenesis/stability protein PilW [Nitrosomonas eutropha]SFU56979.1 type IV pilus assembly protein PilF [Nitrosomonas eutropha]
MSNISKLIRAGVVGFLVWLAGCEHVPVQEKPTPEELKQRALQSAKIHTELAGQYYHRGQYRIAIEEAGIALRKKSDYAPAYNMLGLVYMDLQEDGQAEWNFERGLGITPNDPDIRNNFGWFLCQRKPDRMEQAIDHFMAAVRDPLYETPERTYTNAGLCVLKQNNFEQAQGFFQQALVIRPGYALAQLGMVELDFSRGEVKKAWSSIIQYLQTYSPTPGSLWLAVRIARANGDINAETNYAFQLQKRFPDSSEARELRADRLNHER